MLFIIPTDTCFGLGCKIHDIDAYNRIYSLKQRDYNKPLSMLVRDMDFLQRHTTINDMQIDFLNKYRRPFTVLLETKSELINPNLPNKSLYKKVAFRIANRPDQIQLLDTEGSLFLTSANLSGKGEIYKLDDITFKDEDNLTIVPSPDLEEVPPSDIFEFIGHTTKTLYLRKG